MIGVNDICLNIISQKVFELYFYDVISNNWCFVSNKTNIKHILVDFSNIRTVHYFQNKNLLFGFRQNSNFIDLFNPFYQQIIIYDEKIVLNDFFIKYRFRKSIKDDFMVYCSVFIYEYCKYHNLHQTEKYKNCILSDLLFNKLDYITELIKYKNYFINLYKLVLKQNKNELYLKELYEYDRILFFIDNMFDILNRKL